MERRGPKGQKVVTDFLEKVLEPQSFELLQFFSKEERSYLFDLWINYLRKNGTPEQKEMIKDFRTRQEMIREKYGP